MFDLLITTPEELRAFLPSHTYRNLDTIRGFLVNSQNTFLRQRIGQPLLTELLRQYALIAPILPPVVPSAPYYPVCQCPVHDDASVPTDETVPEGSPEGLPAPDAPASATTSPWAILSILCQRCIVYDAQARSADIRALTDNDMGMNVAESDNFDAANDKRVDRYKLQLIKEAHAATDLLLTQLEDWQREAAQLTTATPDTLENPDLSDTAPALTPHQQAITRIIDLWRQSDTYPLTDGLLFNTATEFNKYIDIYNSRERFVELLPDIRYCQELHLESEIGTDLLAWFQQGHRAGTLPPSGEKAYEKLQRTLSLYVEARSSMFKRQDARDEAAGYMRLTNNFITAHQLDFDRKAMSTSPLFALHLWPRFDQDGHPLLPDGTPMLDAEGNPLEPDFDEHGHPIFPALDEHGRPLCPRRHAPGQPPHAAQPPFRGDFRAAQPPFFGHQPEAHRPGTFGPTHHDYTHGHPCHHPDDDPDRAGFLTTTMI